MQRNYSKVTIQQFLEVGVCINFRFSDAFVGSHFAEHYRSKHLPVKKVKNRKNRKWCEIWLTLRMKAPERSQ